MSDKTKCVEEHRRRSNGPLTCEDCRAADIAAAEERGRRAGIEEAARAIKQAAPKSKVGSVEFFEEVIRALAPRDSGPCPEPPPGALEAAEAGARRGGQVGCGNIVMYSLPAKDRK